MDKKKPKLSNKRRKKVGAATEPQWMKKIIKGATSKPKLTKKQKLEVVKEFFADDYPLIKSILDAQNAMRVEDRIGTLRTMLVGMSLAWLLLTCVVVALY